MTFSVNAEVGAIFSRCYDFVVARPPNFVLVDFVTKKQCCEKQTFVLGWIILWALCCG